MKGGGGEGIGGRMNKLKCVLNKIGSSPPNEPHNSAFCPV